MEAAAEQVRFGSGLTAAAPAACGERGAAVARGRGTVPGDTQCHALPIPRPKHAAGTSIALELGGGARQFRQHLGRQWRVAGGNDKAALRAAVAHDEARASVLGQQLEGLARQLVQVAREHAPHT